MSKKKTFSQRFTAILTELGLTAKANTAKENPNALSEDWPAIAAKYKEKYGTDFADDLHAASEEPAVSAEDITQAIGILGTAFAPANDANNGTGAAPAAGADNGTGAAPATAAAGTGTGAADNGGTQTPAQGANAEGAQTVPTNAQTQAPTGEQLINAATRMANALRIVSGQAAEDKPDAVVTGAPVSLMGPATGTTDAYLFGIEHPMFAMSARANVIANNPRMALALPKASPTEEAAFKAQIQTYSESLAQRYAYLHSHNALGDPAKLLAGTFSSDYTGVTDAKVGNQYVIRRQDALIAHILMLRDVTQYFPVRYGIQDHDLLFGAFFTEISQAWQEGEIYKGSMNLQPEMGHVDDAMIKIKFGPMTELERMYIGYLNKEGSDPIKWSMIEFCVLNALKTAQVEQNKRRIRGIYVTPETGVAGSYLTASTGIVYSLFRYAHELKLKMTDDSAYRAYTSADMLDTVQAYISALQLAITEDQELDNHVLYLNNLHKSWWLANVREKYGKDTDFAGPNSYANIVPDTNIRIIWLPYLGPLSYLMFLQVPGNLQFLENVPGEMMAMQMEQQMEMVRGWSRWKEGCAAEFVGKKFTTKAAMDENAYAFQQIFMNKPCVTLAADATAPAASAGIWFVTAANTGATAITDITGAKAGVAYIIELGSTTNATTIAKAGKFATLTEAFTPTAVGDYIMVILNSEGNFLELERQVGGTRTINPLTQPNIPGVR